jgi:hypothetical protein
MAEPARGRRASHIRHEVGTVPFAGAAASDQRAQFKELFPGLLDVFAVPRKGVSPRRPADLDPALGYISGFSERFAQDMIAQASRDPEPKAQPPKPRPDAVFVASPLRSPFQRYPWRCSVTQH